MIRQALLWTFRIGLLWLILSNIAPVQQRILLGEPQTVQTTQPQVCAHTTLINEPDEWKIQHTMEMMREMGASTIVEFFPWAYIETQEGQYNWSQTDKIIKHAQNQGIHIIARMGLVPRWARPEETTLNYIQEDSFDEFAAFIAVFAERYAGTIDHLIIWNEPNLAFEWGYQPIDPAKYARMLQAVYPMAHQANPNITILAGALAPTLEPAGSPNGLNDLLYLQGMYDADVAPYFDVLAIHTYGFEYPAEAKPAADTLNFRRAELLVEIMQQNGDDKPVYITESGWNDSPIWTRGVRPSQRIAYTLGGFQWAAENWDWMQNLCLWIFRYPRDEGNYRDNFALVNAEFQAKPIYYAVQAYARGWQQEDALWLPAPDG